MGVSSIVNRVTLAGNGISTSFGFPYYFFQKADLLVFKYDTLLGGVIGPYVLNTDYTITGTQNYQGLYPSGGTVVFSSLVPLATDIIVIVRSPIQTQNYSLDYGGTISSSAIVQQFDYLTMLVQRLQDEVARCIQVPDGVGVPFSGALPSIVALSPGSSPDVNPSGNGWVLGAGSGGGSSSTVTNGGDANYTILSTDQYVRTGTALTANRTWTMPTAVTVGQKIFVKNTRSQVHNIILAGNGGDLVDGLSTVTLIPDMSASLICTVAGQWDAF